MDDRQKERYFQPFSSSFEEGTGLGAAIVYRLVEEHSGKIQVVSSKGSGTTITILLPHEDSRMPDVSAPRESSEPRLRAVGGWPR